jgi:dTDP-4-amino-4,6-dideoxygalactose transaminase
MRNQLGLLRRRLTGQAAVPPPLSSMTVDPDDVDIANSYLEDRSNWYDPSVVSDYENAFARWNGSTQAYAFMGGRVALSACIHALGLGPGDQVIVPAYTCVVVPNAFRYAGVEVVYSDIELDTYGLDAVLLEERITPKIRAILIQHLYGLVCRDYEAILTLADRFNLRVIEDCAHATGAEFREVKVGNRGDLGFYSSEQSKVFSTVQGGLAVTSDPALAEGLADYRQQASYPDGGSIEHQLQTAVLNYYLFKHPGRWWRGDLAMLRSGGRQLITTTVEEISGIKPAHYGRRMPAPIAALGLNQIRKLDGYNQRRRAGSRRWVKWCEENNYKKPVEIEGSVPVYLRYPVLVESDKKTDRSWALKDPGVAVGAWYRSHIHPTGERLMGFPGADVAVGGCINFPCLMDE